MTLAVAGVGCASFACTGLAGLGDLAFDGDVVAGDQNGESSSSGGNTSSGSSGGATHHSGGCDSADDRLDVGPMVIADHFAGKHGLDIAPMDDLFSVVTSTPFNVEEIRIVTLGADDGLVRREHTIATSDGLSFKQSIAAARGRLAVLAPQIDKTLELHMLDPWFEDVSVITFPAGGLPYGEGLVRGGPDGFLVATMKDSIALHSTFVPELDAAGHAPLTAMPNGHPTCCGYRAWHAGRYADGSFGVALKANRLDVVSEFVSIDAAGKPGSSFVVDEAPLAKFAGPLGDDLVLADCETAVVFAPEQAYLKDTRATGDGSVCAIGMHQSSARMASYDAQTQQLHWAPVLAAGGDETTPILSWDALGEVKEIAMAWDGSGYGVVWKSDAGIDDTLYYAHVEVCSADG